MAEKINISLTPYSAIAVAAIVKNLMDLHPDHGGVKRIYEEFRKQIADNATDDMLSDAELQIKVHGLINTNENY